MRKKTEGVWNLESFLDSLVVELDKAQDTLAVKGINRPLTYSVKELELDLHIFPDFDGDVVRFKTAKPGEEGASKLSFQLGSITSEQIRRTTADPISKDDISIEMIEELDEDTKNNLRKHGIISTRDIKHLEEKNVDMDKIVQFEPGKKTSYKNLANIINRARRKRSAPRVSRVGLAKTSDGMMMSLKGSNLAISKEYEGFPVAALNGKKVEILNATPKELQLRLDNTDPMIGAGQLQIVLDPFAVVRMNLKSSPHIKRGSEQVVENEKKNVISH